MGESNESLTSEDDLLRDPADTRVQASKVDNSLGILGHLGFPGGTVLPNSLVLVSWD